MNSSKNCNSDIVVVIAVVFCFFFVSSICSSRDYSIGKSSSSVSRSSNDYSFNSSNLTSSRCSDSSDSHGY
jgi:hypothetical protein